MPLNPSRRAFGFGLIAVGLTPNLAWADEQAAIYVRALGAEVIHLANGGKRGDKALQKRFADLFARYISIANVANFALGPYQKQLPVADKAMFYDLVANYSAALFVWFVEDFQGESLAIIKTAEQGKFITVDSTIKGGGLIADLNVKGVWLSIAMKKLFADTLRESNGNFQPLYVKLREADTW
jgi:phospholipid transport system substrate-binding protein